MTSPTLQPVSPTTSLFRSFLTGADVELAVAETARAWLTYDYLAEVARQRVAAPDLFPPPRSWVVSGSTEKMPEESCPAIVIASPGVTDEPRAGGDGIYTARFAIEISAHCAARGEQRLALRNARLYVGALRALFLQQQTLLGMLPVVRVDWLGESYDRLSSENDRTVCTATTELAFEIADVVTRNTGPLYPTTPPAGPDSPVWPNAEQVLVHLHKTAITEGY